MKDIIIVGAGDFARLMHQYITECKERRVAAFSVNKEYCNQERINGVPLIPLEELRDSFTPRDCEVIIAAGYSRMGNVRKWLAEQCKSAGYALASFIHPSATVSPSVELGEGNILLDGVNVAPLSKIGDCNLIWTGAQIPHQCIIGNYNTVSVSATLGGCVEIHDNCFLGENCTIIDHIIISDYSLIGAASCLKRNTKPYEARSVTLENRISTEFY